MLNKPNNNHDILYEEAKKVILQFNRVSASLLQRRLEISYERALNIVNQMEAEGLIGPAIGLERRKIFLLKN